MGLLSCVPSGRGLYDRGNPSLYPNGFVGITAKSYGCKWVAVNSSQRARVQVAQDAKSRGLKVWAWSYPDEWLPNTWEQGLERIRENAQQMGAVGIIVDAEEWPAWRAAGRRELERFADQLELAARHIPMGFTTFPSWGGKDVIRERVPSLSWVNPQVYGVRNGPKKADEGPLQWADQWKREWRQPVIPALAAWGREPDDAAEYLAAFNWKYRGVIYWTGRTVWTDPVRVKALRSVRTVPSPGNILGGLTAVAVVAGAAAMLGGK